MADKPQLIAVNKLDVTEVREQRQELSARLSDAVREEGGGDEDAEIMFISAATGEGVDRLLRKIGGTLASLPKEAELLEVPAPRTWVSSRERRPERVRVEGGVFIIESEPLERLSALADTRDQRVLVQLWGEMRKTGLAQKLVDAGIEVGDTIRLGKVEVEWF